MTPVPSQRRFWRVQLALTLAMSLSIAALTLLYRYMSGEWSATGLFLGAAVLGTGGLAWLLRPPGPEA